MRMRKKEKLTYEQTSKRFGVAIRTLFNWAKKLEPEKTRNKPATKIDMKALKKDVEENPDRFQYERAKDYGVTPWAIGLALKRLKISRKKTLYHPKTDIVKRVKFQGKLLWHQYFEKRPIVYLDESGFAVDTPRPHGYSQRGARCYGCKDWHARGRLNAIGAIIDFKFITVSLFDSYVDSEVFFAWSQQDLLPKLPPHSVIVLDNATFHKRSDILQLYQNAGHTLLFLPPYSPDLNPIEQNWAQAKSIRRRSLCSPFNLFSAPNYANL